MEHPKKQPPLMGLQELERRAMSILELSNDLLRKEFIEIARVESPTQTYEKAFDLAVGHFDARIAITFAKAARFLAMIRRDYGQGMFDEMVS